MTLPKIFIVDDEPEIVDLLRTQFELSGLTCEMFGSAEQFIQRAPWSEVGCLITDLRMPKMGGRELIDLCYQNDPAFSVIVYSATADIVTTVDAMRAGVHYVFEKGRPLKLLSEIVSEAISTSKKRLVVRRTRERTRAAVARLTSREREVMHKVAAGLASKVIAAELGISVNTVEIHRGRVMRKMEMASVAELARALAALGL